MLLVFHEGRLLGRQLLKHSRDGGGANAKMPRQCVACDALPFKAAELQDRFQIIVNRFGIIRASRNGSSTAAARFGKWHAFIV